MSNYWNDNEKDFLYANVGELKINTIARRLERSPNGVIIKMKDLKIGNTKNQTGKLTMGELARYLGVDRKTVENWAIRHGLPFQKKKTRQIRTFYLVDTIEFWDWAYYHQDRIDFSKIEPQSIPPEPKWVDSLRVQKREIKGNHYQLWTTKEESVLLELREQGKSYKYIAQKLNKTPISVERKYKRLLHKKNK